MADATCERQAHAIGQHGLIRRLGCAALAIESFQNLAQEMNAHAFAHESPQDLSEQVRGDAEARQLAYERGLFPFQLIEHALHVAHAETHIGVQACAAREIVGERLEQRWARELRVIADRIGQATKAQAMGARRQRRIFRDGKVRQGKAPALSNQLLGTHDGVFEGWVRFAAHEQLASEGGAEPQRELGRGAGMTGRRERMVRSRLGTHSQQRAGHGHRSKRPARNARHDRKHGQDERAHEQHARIAKQLLCDIAAQGSVAAIAGDARHGQSCCSRAK